MFEGGVPTFWTPKGGLQKWKMTTPPVQGFWSYMYIGGCVCFFFYYFLFLIAIFV